MDLFRSDKAGLLFFFFFDGHFWEFAEEESEAEREV